MPEDFIAWLELFEAEALITEFMIHAIEPVSGGSASAFVGRVVD